MQLTQLVKQALDQGLSAEEIAQSMLNALDRAVQIKQAEDLYREGFEKAANEAGVDPRDVLKSLSSEMRERAKTDPSAAEGIRSTIHNLATRGQPMSMLERYAPTALGAGLGAGAGYLTSAKDEETGERENATRNALLGALAGGGAGYVGNRLYQGKALQNRAADALNYPADKLTPPVRAQLAANALATHASSPWAVGGEVLKHR